MFPTRTPAVVHVPASPAGRRPGGVGRRLVGAAVLGGVALVALVGLDAPTAWAHHADITGSSACADATGWSVDFTATSWSKNITIGAGNPTIIVSYQLSNAGGPVGARVTLPQKPSYAFTTANNFEFSDSVRVPIDHDATQLRLYVRAGAPWSSGDRNTEEHSSGLVPLPTNCSPGTATTTITTTTTTSPSTTTTRSTTPSTQPGGATSTSVATTTTMHTAGSTTTLSPSGQVVSPSTTVAVQAATATVTAGGALPTTGSRTAPLLILGAGLVLVGAAAGVVGRFARRER